MRWNSIRKIIENNFTKVKYTQKNILTKGKNTSSFFPKNSIHLDEIPNWLHKQKLTYDQPSLVGLYFGSICDSKDINDALRICKDEDKKEFKLTDHDIESLQNLLYKWLGKQNRWRQNRPEALRLILKLK